jgi:hypothetical protein
MYNSRLNNKPSFKPSASRESLGAGGRSSSGANKWKIAPSPKRPAWNSKCFFTISFHLNFNLQTKLTIHQALCLEEWAT